MKKFHDEDWNTCYRLGWGDGFMAGTFAGITLVGIAGALTVGLTWWMAT